VTKRPKIVEIARQGRLQEVLHPAKPPYVDGRPGCEGLNTEAFFSENEFQTRRVLQICSTCEVLTDCRNWAIENLSHGIAGGMTAEQRAGIRAGKGVLDDHTKMTARLEFHHILTTSIRLLALEYLVSERQIVRWRNLLTSFGEVA